MAGRVVFLLEEPSMGVLLDAWLPRLVPGWARDHHYLCVPHEGKSDLDRSVPRKLMQWRIPGDRFVVVRDNDGADCVDLKARIAALCKAAGRPDTLVRIVCQELESWYLGDLAALAMAFGMNRLDTPGNRKRYARPDEWRKPSLEVKRLVPSFQKRSAARAMAAHLDPSVSLSSSLVAFAAGVRRIAREMDGGATLCE